MIKSILKDFAKNRSKASYNDKILKKIADYRAENKEKDNSSTIIDDLAKN